MASATEIKTKFESLMKENKAARGKVEDLLGDVKSEKVICDLQAKDLLNALATRLTYTKQIDALKTLSVAIGIDFDAARLKELAESQERKTELFNMRNIYGTEPIYTNKTIKLRQDIQDLTESVATTSSALGKLLPEQHANAIRIFNEKADNSKGPHLNEKEFGYFKSRGWFGHIVGMIFDSYYRAGAYILRQYEKKVMPFDQMVTEKKKLEEQDAAQKENLAMLEEQLAVIKAPYDKMDALEKSIVSESQAKTNMADRIWHALLSDDALNTAAKAIPALIPAALICRRAGSRMYAGMISQLEPCVADMKKIHKELDSPIDKLEGAIRYDYDDDIDVNLNKIEGVCDASRDKALYMAKELGQAFVTARSIQEPTAGAAAGYQESPVNFMTYYLIQQMLAGPQKSDAYAINETIGIPDSLAKNLGIILGSLKPAMANIDDMKIGKLSIPDAPFDGIDDPPPAPTPSYSSSSNSSFTISSGGFSRGGGGGFGGFGGGSFGGGGAGGSW